MIKDFGEKIEGARKDLWRKTGLTSEYLEDMGSAEITKYCTKEYVWPMPPVKKQVEEVGDTFTAYWQREIRKMVYPRPKKFYGMPLDPKKYVTLVSQIKEEVSRCKCENDIMEFYNSVEVHYKDRWGTVVNMYDLQNSFWHLTYWKRKMIRSGFPNSTTRTGAKRKERLIPPQLESMQREGSDFRNGRHITPEKWQEVLGFRGVQFWKLD